MNFSSIIVIGLGGTGSNLMPSLTRLLYSNKFTGNIILVDGDKYSDSNVDRQIFGQEAGLTVNKAEYQARVIEAHVPRLAEQVMVVDRYLSATDVKSLVKEDCLVINCADNSAIRKHVEDRVATLTNGVHICCGNEMRGGQVQVYVRRDGVNVTPSIYGRSPEFNSDKDDRSKMDCLALSQLPSGGQLVCANAMAAVLALNYVHQLMSDEDMYMDGRFVPCATVEFDIGMNSFARHDVKEMSLGEIGQYREFKAANAAKNVPPAAAPTKTKNPRITKRTPTPKRKKTTSVKTDNSGEAAAPADSAGAVAARA